MEALMPAVPLIDPTEFFYGTLGHRREIHDAWLGLDEAMVGPGSTLPSPLKENVRHTIAQGIGCRYCASLGAPADQRDRRESLAVAFAERVLDDPRSIDAATFDVLREDFSDAQIVELCAWICFKLGANVFGAIMGLEPATDAQKAMFAGMLADQQAVSR
jgi:alkylhydroperoxidase family enzyme